MPGLPLPLSSADAAETQQMSCAAKLPPNYDRHITFTRYCQRIIEGLVTGYTEAEGRAADALEESIFGAIWR